MIYGAIRNAIMWTEVFLGVPPPGETESSIQFFVAERVDPATAVKMTIEVCREEIEEADSPTLKEAARLAHAEMHLPEFLTYMAGKLGAV